MRHVFPPVDGDDWLGLTDAALPVGELYEWCVRPDCGAVVLFSGTVRDHAEGRTDVRRLEYEAYDEMVVPKLAEIAAEARARWPMIGRLVLVHRVGSLELGESSVVAAVSAPHRAEAFAAARFAIDALKVSVPVWKREVWAGWLRVGHQRPGADRCGRRGSHRSRGPLTWPSSSSCWWWLPSPRSS